jgi:Ca-activated chloride channel family protein
MKLTKAILSGTLAAALLLAPLTGCTQYEEGSEKVYSYDEAITELNAFNSKISTDAKTPRLDIYDDDTQNKALADIKTFPITVQGNGDINLEIAAPSELSGSAPDDWINVVAERFNNEKKTVGGKTVSVTVTVECKVENTAAEVLLSNKALVGSFCFKRFYIKL